MREEGYASAGMDMKKWILCLLKRLPLILAATAGCAILVTAVYTIARTVPASEREYRAQTKIYLDFAADETGEIYQEYNGYTWNDLMATDPILDLTMAALPADYEREEVMAATKAEILSDLRLLTVTITTGDGGRTDVILTATQKALEAYGDSAKEFTQIRSIQTMPARLVTADDRTVQATLVGLLVGLTVSLFGVMLSYVLDDRIYVAGDVRKMTNMSFLGYPGAGENFQNDYDNNLAYLKEQRGDVRVCEIEQGEALTQETLQKLREADAVALTVPYARLHGSYLYYVIQQLEVQGCVLCGVAVRDADRRFLGRYYGRAFGTERS